MARYTLFAAFLFAIAAFAQVTVTSSGFATTPGTAYPAIPASPPILYTPVVHLGEASTQTIQATPANNGVGFMPIMVAPVEGAGQVPLNEGETQPNPNVFNFGAAQFESVPENTGLNSSGKSLAELAREHRSGPSGSNVRVYTNSDIDQLNAVGNSVNTPSAQRNYGADNWSPNNGIINPNGPPAQGVISAPEEQNHQPATGVQGPFAPKPQTGQPPSATPNQPQVRPQAAVRPLLQRETEPVEIAQNQTPPSPTVPEDKAQEKNSGQLPRTASKLPLVGVAGLFSISMGIFVRYQRSRAK